MFLFADDCRILHVQAGPKSQTFSLAQSKYDQAGSIFQASLPAFTKSLNEKYAALPSERDFSYSEKYPEQQRHTVHP